MKTKSRKKSKPKPAKRRAKAASAKSPKRKAKTKKKKKTAKSAKRPAKRKPTKKKPAKKKAAKKKPAKKKPAKRRPKKPLRGKKPKHAGTMNPARKIRVYGSGEYCWSNDVRDGFLDGRPIRYCVIDGLAIYEGDIVLGTAREMDTLTSAIKTGLPPNVLFAIRTLPTLGQGRRWPNGILPYKIDPSIDVKGRIDDAIALFRLVTNIRFVERTNETDYVYFLNFSGRTCSSAVGVQGGAQDINVVPTCDGGEIAHEICHALGLKHEQSRFDRDDFVTIHWDNIEGTTNDGRDGRDDPPARNFQKADPPGTDPVTGNVTGHENFGAYDYHSIMHYSRDAFGRRTGPGDTGPRKETITPKGNPAPDLGQRSYLSAGDIAVLNDMYPAVPMTLPEASDTGPAIAEKNGAILIAWKGRGSDSLNTIQSLDGLGFAGKATLGERSLNAPALAVLGDKYVVAWTGVGNNKINIMQSIDGVAWGNKVTLEETSPSPPALATHGPDVFLAWRGGDDRINLMRFIGGAFPPPGAPVPKNTTMEKSESGPALCRHGPNVLLAWRGTGNNKLNIVPFGLTLFPGPKVTLNNATDDRPALCSSGNRAFLGWRGTGNGRVNVMGSADGVSWSDANKVTTAETCLGGPAIVNVGWSQNNGGRVVRAWTDDGAGNALITFLLDLP